MVVNTHGLTHLSLAVRNPDVSMRFYASAFGFEEYYSDSDSIQARRPGGWEILAFEKDRKNAGAVGGIQHFGFRLVDADDIDRAIQAVIAAGGQLLRRGEFAPGLPFAYVSDPDGYEIEIWYE